MRSIEQSVVTNDDDINYVAIYSLLANTRLSAGLSIAATCFTCFVLAGGALLFTSQCNDLVVTPIE
jgi:hypothetical protein